MTTYRRRKNSETWHWREECHLWPTLPTREPYIELKAERIPNNGLLCDRCVDIDLNTTVTFNGP